MAEEPSKSQTWWQTLPGILTAVAATITAIGGLIIALKSASNPTTTSQPTLSSAQISSPSQPQSPNLPTSPGNLSGLCKELENKSIVFYANNYRGVIGSTGIKLQETKPGRFRFETEVLFSGENIIKEFSHPLRDRIIGVCEDEDKSITLNRTLENGTFQLYTGRIFKADTGKAEMKGNFEDGQKSYTWSGWLDSLSQ